MYQNLYYNRNTNTIHLFDDEQGHLQFEFNKYCFIKSPTGRYSALDGTRVEKLTRWAQSDEGSGLLYESDVSPEMRTLIDRYHETDEVSKNHRLMVIDIEVDSTNNFPDYRTPENKITAIAGYCKTVDSFYCLILDEAGILKESTKDNIKVIPYRTEADLLNDFLMVYSGYEPTIITGWNIDGFDIPYLYSRLCKVLGRKMANVLSPIGIVEQNKRTGIFNIAGVSCLDYLPLYKKYTAGEEPSYSLDAISNKELGRGKLKYDGSLDNLFKTDINKFIEYNLNDVLLVLDLDKKLNYIELTRNICHKGHVTYTSIYTSSKYLEGAILTYMKRLGIVAPNRPEFSDEDFEPSQSDDDEDNPNNASFEGAYVKPPKPGRYEWLTCLDATSLYPSCIMTLNISPETKVGKVLDWDCANMLAVSKGKTLVDTSKLIFRPVSGKDKILSKEEVLDFVRSNGYSIAGNGAIYKTDSKGLIPAILENWFDERVKYKKLMKAHSNDDKELSEHFDRMQYTVKILLNSMYGVLGLKSFRFHDLDNAEAVTVTGQDTLRFADKMSNKYLSVNFNSKEDMVVYEDTDSVYIYLDEFITHQVDRTPTEQVIDLSGKIAAYINDAMPAFVKSHLNSSYNKLVFKEESVISAAFWLAKKRYAYKKVYDLEAEKYTDKLVVKGLDAVRSNFPKLFRSFMKEILLDILSFVDKSKIDTKIAELKTNMDKFSIEEISKPTGVKGLDKYTRTAGPAHIKAALNYNFLLGKFGYEKKLQPILNGGKVKWVYLLDNPYGMDGLAFKGYDDPKEIMDIVNQYVDRNMVFTSNLEKKLNNFYDALQWGQIPDTNKLDIENFFSF